MHRSIGSVQRAIDILELFGGQTPELGITEIAEARGLHKSTAAGLVYTLERNGFLEQNPQNRKYRLGLKLVERALTVLDQLDVRKLALSYLQALHDWCDESVNLGILSGGHVVYIDRLDSTHALGVSAKIGRRSPVHCTAMGKAIMAHLPRPRVHAILSQYGMPALTEHTLTDPGPFLRELEMVRARGFALDNQENDLGGRCIAAPVFDHMGHPVAAISICAPLGRLPLSEVARFGEKVRESARQISHRLGYAGAGRY